MTKKIHLFYLFFDTDRDQELLILVPKYEYCKKPFILCNIEPVYINQKKEFRIVIEKISKYLQVL